MILKSGSFAAFFKNVKIQTLENAVNTTAAADSRISFYPKVTAIRKKSNIQQS